MWRQYRLNRGNFFFLPNLVWWCIITIESVFRKDWFAIFQVKATMKDRVIKVILFNTSFKLLILLQWNFDWWHIIINWIVFWNDWIILLLSRTRSQERFRIAVTVYLDDISSTAEPFVNKLCMVIRQHGLECYDRKWFAVFDIKVIVSAQIIKHDCFYHIYWTADLFATKYNWMVHHYKLECLVWNGIVVFAVKVTVKVQNFIESLCIFFSCGTDLLATKVGVLMYCF